MMPPRPAPSIWLTLAAYAGIALAYLADALKYIEKGNPMLPHNQDLLYGLRKAIATVEACDRDGLELGTITVAGPMPSFTTQSAPFDGGPELPRFEATR